MSTTTLYVYTPDLEVRFWIAKLKQILISGRFYPSCCGITPPEACLSAPSALCCHSAAKCSMVSWEVVLYGMSQVIDHLCTMECFIIEIVENGQVDSHPGVIISSKLGKSFS